MIRDSCGQIIKMFSGAVDCFDANRAEVYAMLMGSRKLFQMDAFDGIVEGDSLCAIQWGSSVAICPWRLAVWVDEIQYISSQLHCSFSHVLREANGIAYELATEGVSVGMA